jgi:cobalt-zinc-cadmium resistance protein CzcA
VLDGIIRFSLTQRLFISLLVLVLIGLGTKAWIDLPIDAYPDISPTQVKLILKAPGMTAEEIELQVTRPIEAELLGIPDQSILRSTTKYAITAITLDFIEGTDIYWARQQVNERLLNIWDTLLDGVSGGIAPMSTPLSEMFMFTLENPALSLMQRRELLDWEIRPVLRTVPGVADVNVLGGYVRSYQIEPRMAELAALGLTLEDLEDILARNNLNTGAGRLTEGNDVLITRTEGRLQNADQLRDLVVSSREGQVYRLGDIAQVGTGHLTRYGSVTRDGEETVEALVIALKGAATAVVVEGVKARLAELEPTLPAGSRFNVFYDRSVLIATAVRTITMALLQAVVLVVALLALFMGNPRPALTVSASLPLAALASFFLMQQYGLSANLMSLGGLVIAIGMLVDASVVVVENITAQLSADPGLPRLHLIYRASKDVAKPVVAGTLVVLIVFSPLLTLEGLEGRLFTPVALTIVFAMVSALVLALTVMPILASVLLGPRGHPAPGYVRNLQSRYRRSLQRSIDAPRPMLAVLTLLLGLSALLYMLTGKTFMPTLDEGDLIVQTEKVPTISLQASTALDLQVERALLEAVPEIRQVVARTGSDELGLDPMGLNETDVFMELAPRREWRAGSKDALTARIREVMLQFPGVNFNFTQPIQMRVSEMLTGTTGDVAIKVFGNDITELARLVDDIRALVRDIPGAVDVQAAVIEGGRFLNVDPRPELAARHGATAAHLGQHVRAQLEGTVVSEIIEGRKRIPVVITNRGGSHGADRSLADLGAQLVALPDGSLAPLSAIADLSFKQGPQLIERERGNRFGAVTVNVLGRDIVGFVDQVRQAAQEQIALPAGYYLAFGGEFENQQRASRNLATVVPVALLLILVILFSTFRSLMLAGLILGNIPFALMGGVIALFLSGEYLSVPASVGFIALLGIAVLNGVVMISYFEQPGRTAGELRAQIVEGAVRRLRPILMTATTAMFGLLPLVFATGPGAEIQRPLAIVVVGGLVTSTGTTLYLLPLAYLQLKRRRS